MIGFYVIFYILYMQIVLVLVKYNQENVPIPTFPLLSVCPFSVCLFTNTFAPFEQFNLVKFKFEENAII